MEKLTIEKMKDIAESRKGKCLSEKYINSVTKLKWHCIEGHIWSARPSDIQREHWCPQCGNKRKGESQKLNIEEIQQIALDQGGCCLSSEYINSHTPLLFQCGNEHIWAAKPYSIKQGKWCRYCLRHTIEKMQQIALERGGWCLSHRYINKHTKLWFQCGVCEHIWDAIPSNIIKKSWCPSCAVNAKKATIEEIQLLAQKRGGKCILTEYKNNRQKLLFQCTKGHTWMMSADVMKRGQWCTICSARIGERTCREYFEKLFNKKFIRERPKWLINPITKHLLELDGYCEELKIAFEYNGLQHYKSQPNFYHRNRSFQQQKRDDKNKKLLCKKNGVILIIVPYAIKLDNMKQYIIEKCKDKGMNL